MELINNKASFFKLIEIEEKCIVFCFHDWSAFSVVSKKIVEEWESKFDRKIKVIDASNMNHKDYFPKWLIQKELDDWTKEGIMTINKFSPRKRLHGYGEICWILNEKVKGFECVFNAFNPEALEERTRKLFG